MLFNKTFFVQRRGLFGVNSFYVTRKLAAILRKKTFAVKDLVWYGMGYVCL